MTIKKVSCVICNLDFHLAGRYGIAFHVKMSHNLSPQQYYDSFLGKNDNKCVICNKKLKFKSIGKGYAKVCSQTCVNFLVHKTFPEKRNKFRAMVKSPLIEKNRIERINKYAKSPEGRLKSSITSKNNWKTNIVMRKKLHKCEFSLNQILRSGSPKNVEKAKSLLEWVKQESRI